MPVIQPLCLGKNAIDINNRDFDISLSYEIKLTSLVYCAKTVVVDVDGVSFCKEVANLKFELPCMDLGQYKLEVINKANDKVLYTVNSKFYK